MTFRQFAALFSELDAPLGDLAGDICGDKELNDAWNPKRIKSYLKFRCGYDDRSSMIGALVDLYRLGVAGVDER